MIYARIFVRLTPPYHLFITHRRNVMAKNPIAWFEIYTDNLDRAKKFYESVFDIELEKITPPNEAELQMLAFPSNMEANGASGALVKMNDFGAGGNSTIVYFGCDDCAIEESRVEKSGGKVQQSKMSIGEYGFISMILDTEGNMIGLYSMK